MSWTDERVALLKKMWGEGKSAAEIAKVLGGGLTRNAVIGKAHRLKLSNRVSPIQQNNKKVSEPTLVRNVSAAPVAAEPVKKVVLVKDKTPSAPRKGSGGIAMVNLRDRMCRWPEGDPKEPGFSFCGDECVAGLPYCDHHAKMAYQAPSRSRALAPEDFERETPQRYDLDEELKEATTSA
jgi:GcrA cell cycle regulator